MNVLEKAEKALEHLKNIEGSTKSHDLQTAAGVLGRCLGTLGGRQNCARHYANLLHSALPVLLSLASNDSAEVRLVGDEALNRAIVGGFAFHSYKTNIVLQNLIDPNKNARWIRAALSRICLGDTWLRPGMGKIRSQAQTLFPKLSQIVRETNEIQLVVETLENNLPRLLDALAEYTTDEEIFELSTALFPHIQSPEASVRRGAANTVSQLARHRPAVLADTINTVFEKLWPLKTDSATILGWFGAVKALLQANDVSKLSEPDMFVVRDYLELYHLCVFYLERTTVEHNVQNAVIECLTVLLSQAKGSYRKVLLDQHPDPVYLDDRRVKGHRRNISIASAVSLRPVSPLSEAGSELPLEGALRLGSLLRLHSQAGSVEDLVIRTPDSTGSETDIELTNTEQLTRDLSEKLQEIESEAERESEPICNQFYESGVKINIGTSLDDDITLKYCARLLASKFLLVGNKGDIIPDRSVRVSVKASSLNCLSEILRLYPQAMTMFLDKDANSKGHNITGSSEATESSQDQTNDFVVERNVAYQDSLTDSLSQDLLRSTDSQPSHLSKKDSKSESDHKSSLKDVPSNILDSKVNKDLMTSAMTDSTNPNMTNSNFTTGSNMTASNEATGYPMTSSGDVLSSSIDLDMKFDHFGESTTNLDNLKELEVKDKRKALKRTDEVQSKDAPVEKVEVIEAIQEVEEKDFEYQHMFDIFTLLEGHNDPHIRGLVRVCIATYVSAALELCYGDIGRWRCYSGLPKDVSDNVTVEKLVTIVLKGLSDEIHSTVSHTLIALTTLCHSLSNSVHWLSIIDALNSLVVVENNTYWLCKVNLCKLYEKLPYNKLFILLSSAYHTKSKRIMDTLFRLLADQDQKVRNAAAQAIATITPTLNIPKSASSTSILVEMAKESSSLIEFNKKTSSLHLVRDIYFYHDLPDQLKRGAITKNYMSLKRIIGDLVSKLMASSCKYYSQGMLEALQTLANKWSPWKHHDAYKDQGILAYCLDCLDYCNGSVVTRTALMDLCCLVYPVEIHNIMRHKTTNRDIFERDNTTRQKWQHLENESMAKMGEKFLQITLKMLNVLAHLIEEVNPNVHLNKTGIALPGSPERWKGNESSQTKQRNPSEIDTDTLRKKRTACLKGHFFHEPFYMKFYEYLRATYSNYKINLDPKSSIFYDFLSKVLNSLTIQLELSTEKEFGNVTEEILYYLKVIMPLCPDKTVHCVTQLLKCLFGTNMVNQYSDFMSISDKLEEDPKPSFFNDVMMVNSISTDNSEDRRASVTSSASQSLDPSMAEEKQLLMKMENFAKNRTDKKWSTNKKELERYIRLFEPVVIQALKTYTMQNDIPLQCQVLALLFQLLTLRVNYCMLDSDQVFIGFLMRQLEFVEHHEIPNCCDLVYSILMFLVQLSSSKHHTKQIIELPKLIQLCDGLLAAGAHDECSAGLAPVAARAFGPLHGTSVLGRAQQQEAQATREVLFYMLQKTMHQPKVLQLVSCVLSLSQEHPESYYRWSELASDTLLNLLSQRTIEIDTYDSILSLEKLLDSIYRDVLLEQSRVEILLKILFKIPPDQATTSPQQKLRYLSIIMVLLRKVLVLIPETEILLSINYLKSTFVSPQSIFFNVKPDVDPLNVQNVNENCANLSPDVILVRFLFKTLTYALVELDECQASLELKDEGDKVEGDKLLYAVCVNIIVHVKHMLHLTNGCQFPLTSKTAQSLLHNEQSGLNTGLYSPEENIPLDKLNSICMRAAHKLPLLTVHWLHLMIRLGFLSHSYWQRLGAPPHSPPGLLHSAAVVAYCEYFVENGLSDVITLTWVLVNLVHCITHLYGESRVQAFVARVQAASSASGLLLQAAAARCQRCFTGEFALNTFKILSLCHESQSGPLVFLICRIIGKMEPAIAARFAKLAIERCRLLKEMPIDKVNEQLTKEDVQIALELLQRDKVHTRCTSLVVELNALASSVFDLSPLDLSQDRAVKPQYIITTNVDSNWLVSQVKSRCCQSNCGSLKIPKHEELSTLLSKLSTDDLTSVLTCPEFDRKLLASCFKVSSDKYLKEFVNVVSLVEIREGEKDRLREQKEIAKLREEMTSSVDSNKLNVANTIQVFKKSDKKEGKSQFFIPINDIENLKESFGNLHITEEDTELIPPNLPDLYTAAVNAFDKCLTDVIRLFPKQSRPLSQSENFNLNIEQTIDRYTRRCHQVFQDKLFYQEFVTMQTILAGLLDALDKIIGTIDEADCDLLEKYIDNIIPVTLSKNIAIFSVISLQYLSFLIKNKTLLESPIHSNVSFRETSTVTDNVIVDNVIAATLNNVAEALSFDEIWNELNVDSNVNRTQSAISCLYGIVKYLVKDTKPLIPKTHMHSEESPKPDIFICGDKIVTLIDYWENNFYVNINNDVLAKCFSKPIETLIVSLSRLSILSNIPLIPPIAWSSVDLTAKKEQFKVDLPLQALHDLDVLEAFLFRVNLISWSSKKQFEEIWVALLGALQGESPSRAARGLAQLLLRAVPRGRRRGCEHVARGGWVGPRGMQHLRTILFGTKAYRLFENVNLERIPLSSDEFDGYHYAQFNAEYLKLAADIVDEGPYYVRQAVKRKKKNTDIDLNSCIQLLMDVASQMLEPEAPTSASTRVALLWSICTTDSQLCDAAQWCQLAHTLTSCAGGSAGGGAQRALLLGLARCLAVLHGFQGLQELTSVYQKLLKSLTSNYAPLRQAALQGCLLSLAGKQGLVGLPANPCQELVGQLNVAVRQYLAPNTRISLYEQSLYWTVLFTLIEFGHPDLINLAVDFLLNHPRHYCVDLVVKGITTTIRQQILPKDLKNSVIEKLLDNMKRYSEHHGIQVLMVHLFSADNKLLSPKLASDVSNMDPDVLMNSMERITLLYKVLRQVKQKESKEIVTSALKYFLRETLPPSATISRVVIEFLETCKETERLDVGVLSDRDRLLQCAVFNADIVFEVFQTAVAQDQLSLVSGWLFEALSHLLFGKISTNLLPYCLLTLLISASPNNTIRQLSSLNNTVLKLGFTKNAENDNSWGVFKEFSVANNGMAFQDRRLLCVVALHSFTGSQLGKLKELCENVDSLHDLLQCLNV